MSQMLAWRARCACPIDQSIAVTHGRRQLPASCIGIVNDAAEFALWLSPHILINTGRVLASVLKMPEGEIDEYLAVPADADLTTMLPWRGRPVIEPAQFASLVDASRRSRRGSLQTPRSVHDKPSHMCRPASSRRQPTRRVQCRGDSPALDHISFGNVPGPHAMAGGSYCR